MPTNKFLVSRIITATAVLVDESDPVNCTEINNVVLLRAAFLMQRLWQVQFPKLTKRYQITDFWRRVVKQAKNSEDIADLEIICDETINPPGCPYGEIVQINLKINPGHLLRVIRITAKKG